MVQTALLRKGLLLLGLLLATGIAGPAAADCRIAVLGDSLTAGYGLAAGEGFPAQLEGALRADGFNCALIDAGVSGDTSAGGLARLDWLLADQPSHVIVELGANDALRALPVDQLAANLDAILARLRDEGIPALLAGMLAPPNLGRDYGEAFAAVYADLAERHGVPLYPFFLDGVALRPELLLPDRLHPTAEGVGVIVAGILPTVRAWLEATAADARS
jgi:acyl-CoA thioesterase-1